MAHQFLPARPLAAALHHTSRALLLAAAVPRLASRPTPRTLDPCHVVRTFVPVPATSPSSSATFPNSATSAASATSATSMDTRIEEYLQAKCRNRECTNLRGQADKPRSLYCSSRCQSREQNLRQGRIKHARRRPTRTKLGVLPAQQKHRYSELAPEVLQAQTLLNLNAAEAAAGSQSAVVATAVALARSRSTSPPTTPWPSPTRGTYSSPPTPEPRYQPQVSPYSHSLPHHQQQHQHHQSQPYHPLAHHQQQQQHQQHYYHQPQPQHHHFAARPYAMPSSYAPSSFEPAHPLSYGPSPLLSLVSATLDEQHQLQQQQQQPQAALPPAHSRFEPVPLPSPSHLQVHHHLFPSKPTFQSALTEPPRSVDSCASRSHAASAMPASFSSSSSVCSPQPTSSAAKPATLLLPGSMPRTSTTFASSPPGGASPNSSAVVLPAIVSYD